MFHSFLSGRGRLPVTNCLLVVLLVFFILISGCQQPGSVTGEVPLLSSGMVPQVELDGFILARQEKPFIVSRELSGLENDIAVSSFTGWISPSAGQEIVGFNLEFSKVEDAQNIYNYLAAREDTWLYLSGNKVFLVRGGGPESEALKQAITGNKFVSPLSIFPEALNLAPFMSEFPGLKPFAGGVGRIAPRILNVNLEGLPVQSGAMFIEIMEKARIDLVAFASYSRFPLDTSVIAYPQDFNKLQVGTLITGKTEYPGFIFSFLFPRIVSRLGVESMDINGKTAFSRVENIDNRDVHIMISNMSNYIICSVSYDPAMARNLLAEAIAVQQ